MSAKRLECKDTVRMVEIDKIKLRDLHQSGGHLNIELEKRDWFQCR